MSEEAGEPEVPAEVSTTSAEEVKPEPVSEESLKRGRGRPKGSPNKPKIRIEPIAEVREIPAAPEPEPPKPAPKKREQPVRMESQRTEEPRMTHEEIMQYAQRHWQTQRAMTNNSKASRYDALVSAMFS